MLLFMRNDFIFILSIIILYYRIFIYFGCYKICKIGKMLSIFNLCQFNIFCDLKKIVKKVKIRLSRKLYIVCFMRDVEMKRNYIFVFYFKYNNLIFYFFQFLIMNNEVRKTFTVGEIVNLMSVDCQRMQDLSGYLWMIWLVLVQIILVMYLLWIQLGLFVLVGNSYINVIYIYVYLFILKF